MARRNRNKNQATRKARSAKVAIRSEQVNSRPAPLSARPADAESLIAKPVSVSRIVSVDVSADVSADRERVTLLELPEIANPVELKPSMESRASELEEDPSELELDPLDEAFFQEAKAQEQREIAKVDSFPPVAEDMESRVLAPSPAQLARRGHFRKVVGAVVVLSALVFAGGLGKSMVSHSASAAESSSIPAESVVVSTPALPQAMPQATPVVEAPKVQSPEPRPVEAPKQLEPNVEAEVEPELEDPRAEALNLLNRGKMRDAIPMSQAAIRKDPEHALGYLYLGTAYQSVGQHKDAMAAYSDCVRNAKNGPVWECRAMGGRP